MELDLVIEKMIIKDKKIGKKNNYTSYLSNWTISSELSKKAYISDLSFNF